ncbi:hypothetical protein [Blastomonas sp. AAP53]|uniref:PAS domain-containing protein n=1 Tax=Blastomonas sp. AAP53 TaxID=1248760 RepID=UPI0002FEAD28|nr:hypothetical protein [Blastomonas sp. AAP53]
MDTLRGYRDGANGHDDADDAQLAAAVVDSDDEALMDPPQGFGSDERRMHVRAYNYWAKLLGNRVFPSIEDLDPENIEDFGPHSVLLDFTSGIENPAIPFIGRALREESDLPDAVAYLDEVPGRSLLSRITDHYMQILANQAPIGFEAEYVNDRGSTIMYRGILLPFSTDDDSIDFVYGVINWKELADRTLTEQLILQIDEVVKQSPRKPALPIWEDDPAQISAPGELGLDPLDEPLALDGYAMFDTVADGLVEIGFGGEDSEPAANPFPAVELPGGDAALADLLDFARAHVEAALASEERSRAALYAAIGRAYDFALAARGRPDDYAALLSASGITAQLRAPMTPLVKLVFGASYDKTRLAEYACVLSHAMRRDVPRGGLADVLMQQVGGLKAIVQIERRARRARDEDAEKLCRKHETRQKLRANPSTPMGAFDIGDCEFAVLVARRNADGVLGVIGMVDESDPLADRILRKLAG